MFNKRYPYHWGSDCLSSHVPNNIIRQKLKWYTFYPAGNYMFKVNKRNTRTRCEICSKLALRTSERQKNDTMFNKSYPYHWGSDCLSSQVNNNSIRQNLKWYTFYPAGNYMFKVNNKDTRTKPLVSFWCLYCKL